MFEAEPEKIDECSEYLLEFFRQNGKRAFIGSKETENFRELLIEFKLDFILFKFTETKCFSFRKLGDINYCLKAQELGHLEIMEIYRNDR